MDTQDKALTQIIELLDFRLAKIELEKIRAEQFNERRSKEMMRMQADISNLELQSQEIISQLQIQCAEEERLLALDLSLQQSLETTSEEVKNNRVISEKRLEISQKRLQQANSQVESVLKQNQLLGGQVQELHEALGKRIHVSFLKTFMCQHCCSKLRSVLAEESLSAVRASTMSMSVKQKQGLSDTCCFCPRD